MKDALVSIIMPAYNAERYIGEAIGSVLAQTHTNWELLVVNDGSTDGTRVVIERFDDPRIRVFHKPNGGIGSARNMALPHVRGAFLCGLDSDDVFPPRSLEARLQVFAEHPGTDIVDGRVVFMDATLTKTLRVFTPTYTGEPFRELVRLSGDCYMGFSWMIRWPPERSIRFPEDLSHGEDLVFCMEYAPGKTYRYTQDTVLIYRRTGHSSMADLDGLERSYQRMEGWLREQGLASPFELARFRWRRKRIMAGSFWHAGRPWSSVRALLR
jgi:glycosyltransferase involved in cell wall biosynthesis